MKQILPKGYRSVEVESLVLGRVLVDAPATSNPFTAPQAAAQGCVSVYQCICVSVYLYICVSAYLCICVSVYLYICVAVYLCICVSLYLRICVSVYLCICVSEGVGWWVFLQALLKN